ncbi:hypothetical protein HID58_072449 [Brassica napus]|uniref:Uncharacterized protein n=1 Tax=Brassica napus TaxID=3708 RepID=A0ABQ7Z4G7_BRANA|nr:hypothetical protein HID58_072449 [Brassica napus]
MLATLRQKRVPPRFTAPWRYFRLSVQPPTHLSRYCNNSFDNMGHDYFGDVRVLWKRSFRCTLISPITHSTALDVGWSDHEPISLQC